jgi:YbbR domain-containing protein
VRLTLRGPEQAFRLMDPGAIVVSLDMSRLKSGDNEFVIAADNLQLPSALTLSHVEPAKLDVHATPLISSTVDVRVKTSGQLPAGLQFVSATPSPQRITLLCPQSAQRPDHAWTEPIDLGRVKSSTTVKTRIVLPKNARLPDGKNPEVSVGIEVRTSSP